MHFIDDEPLAIKVSSSFAKRFDTIEVVGYYNNSVKAFETLENNFVDVDVLFIDINMPRLNGLDFIKNLTKDIIVVISTACREYTVDTYHLDVLTIW